MFNFALWVPKGGLEFILVNYSKGIRSKTFHKGRLNSQDQELCI